LQSSEDFEEIPRKEPRHQLRKVMFGDEAPILAKNKAKNKKKKKADGEVKKRKKEEIIPNPAEDIINLESRGVETIQKENQCSNSDVAAIHKEALRLNRNACWFPKNEKSFPHSPGGECQQVQFVPLGRSMKTI
jgi:hypothetical protein